MARAKFKPLPPLTQRDIDRFWSKIHRRSPDECWPWITTEFDSDYGTFSVKHITYKANRIALFIGTGVDPRENEACHSCDFKPCCNPSHLFAGTHTDNMSDMISKQYRQEAKGEDHGLSKLTIEKVMEIRKRYVPSGKGIKSGAYLLAKEFNISTSQLYFVATGRAWKHVPMNVKDDSSSENS